MRGSLPERYLADIRQFRGLEPDDTSLDKQIARMSKIEQLNAIAHWNGLILYADTIRAWVEDVYHIDLAKGAYKPTFEQGRIERIDIVRPFKAKLDATGNRAMADFDMPLYGEITMVRGKERAAYAISDFVLTVKDEQVDAA